MCAQMFTSGRSLSCALIGMLLTAGAARAQVVADSVAGFSGVQGQSGWWYGFYDGDPPTPFTPADFEQFPTFDGATPPGVWYRALGIGGYWTAINSLAAHPNGTDGAGGRLMEENWAVRRWICPARMSIRITGHVADTGAGGGNGSLAIVLVNGIERFHRVIADGDTVGADFDFEACIDPGQTVDFALAPNGASEVSDGAYYNCSVRGPIDSQPEPVHRCGAGSAAFSVTAGGSGPFRYQWYKDGQPIPSATSASYTIPSVHKTDAGAYSCLVTVFACGSISSDTAMLTVCRPDVNCDGLVDFSDYLEFLTAFDAQDARADFTGDGITDFSDYLEFLNDYADGC